MVQRIERDKNRFREIVRGKVRPDLRKYLSHSELIGRKGKDLISIPLPQLEPPDFRYEFRNLGGVGQGEGEEGTPIAFDPDKGDEPGQAGSQPGEHLIEEVTLDELVEMLAEELELPRIEPKGEKKNITKKIDVYTGISKCGPESLRHFKRTYKEALKRQIMSGEYPGKDPNKPIVYIWGEDKRYRSWKTKPGPVANAVIFYMMDVSGSMADESKEIVRLTSFWTELLLSRKDSYKYVEKVYLTHCAEAQEVDEETFYHTKESGGTVISTVYDLCNNIIDGTVNSVINNKCYPPTDWNIYSFYFSDGDNWEQGDNEKCVDILNILLPKVNQLAYGQVQSYGRGSFKKKIDELFKEEEKWVSTEIRDKDSIYDALKIFLGKGQ